MLHGHWPGIFINMPPPHTASPGLNSQRRSPSGATHAGSIGVSALLCVSGAWKRLRENHSVLDLNQKFLRIYSLNFIFPVLCFLVASVMKLSWSQILIEVQTDEKSYGEVMFYC